MSCFVTGGLRYASTTGYYLAAFQADYGSDVVVNLP